MTDTTTSALTDEQIAALRVVANIVRDRGRGTMRTPGGGMILRPVDDRTLDRWADEAEEATWAVGQIARIGFGRGHAAFAGWVYARWDGHDWRNAEQLPVRPLSNSRLLVEPVPTLLEGQVAVRRISAVSDDWRTYGEQLFRDGRPALAELCSAYQDAIDDAETGR